MIAPAASYTPAVVQRKELLAKRRNPATWAALTFRRTVLVEARVTLLRSIGDTWDQYRRPETRERARALIRLKIAAYRHLDGLGLNAL